MFYSSLYVNNNAGITSLVIVEKNLKSARKLYRVCHVETVSLESGNEPITTYLKNIRENSNYSTRKKVFSQSKRPPKITRTAPVFLMAEKENTGEGIARLRNENITVEGLIFEKNKKWFKEEMPPLRFGCNYHVNPEDVSKAVKNVLKGDRLLFQCNTLLATGLKEDLQRFQTGESPSDLVSALSAAVWFCERVKQIKRY